MKRIFVEASVPVEELLIIPLFRRCSVDLVGVGSHVEAEKDRQLELFRLEAERFCQLMAQGGFWADYTDPASGFPMRSPRGPGLYPDVLGAQALLKMDVISANCCSILSHPLFGTAVYPCTLFACGSPRPALAALRVLYPELAQAQLQELEGQE
jgi:hypothetical protein